MVTLDKNPMIPHHTTVQFRERNDHNKLKVAAVINCISIGELLDHMVNQELKWYTKQEAANTLKGHPNRERLLAAW